MTSTEATATATSPSSEINVLHQQLSQAISESVSLKSKLVELEERLVSLTEQNTRTLRDKNEELDRQRRSNMELQVQNANLEKEIFDLQQQIDMDGSRSVYSESAASIYSDDINSKHAQPLSSVAGRGGGVTQAELDRLNRELLQMSETNNQVSENVQGLLVDLNLQASGVILENQTLEDQLAGLRAINEEQSARIGFLETQNKELTQRLLGNTQQMNGIAFNSNSVHSDSYSYRVALPNHSIPQMNQHQLVNSVDFTPNIADETAGAAPSQIIIQQLQVTNERQENHVESVAEQPGQSTRIQSTNNVVVAAGAVSELEIHNSETENPPPVAVAAAAAAHEQVNGIQKSELRGFASNNNNSQIQNAQHKNNEETTQRELNSCLENNVEEIKPVLEAKQKEIERLETVIADLREELICQQINFDQQIDDLYDSYMQHIEGIQGDIVGSKKTGV